MSFGLVTLLVMVSFSYLMYIQQRDFLYHTDADRAKGLASALASSSTSLVLTNDVAGLQEVLLGFKDAPDLKFALVLSLGKHFHYLNIPHAHTQANYRVARQFY